MCIGIFGLLRQCLMYVAEAGLQLTPDPPAIPSQVPRLQAHTTSPADLGVLFVCWFVWSFFF